MNSNGLKTIHIEFDGSVATLILDHPPVNAITEELLVDLESAFEQMKQQNDIRAVILTASGSNSFVAGADVNVLSRKDFSSIKKFLTRIHTTFNKIENFPKPIICAINSHAAGNGCELAMVCDIRVANRNATFVFPECKFGVVSAGGTTRRLPRFISKGRALYYLFTAEKMTAQEAFDLGFVDFLVEMDGVLSFSKAIALKIAANAPSTVSSIKRLVRKGQDLPTQEALKEELRQSVNSCKTDDFIEGFTAFLEKRTPVFKGM